MVNQYTKLILLGCLINGSLAYSYYGRLTGITNNYPYKVTVQTSDTLGSINGKPVVQNKEYDLRNINSMDLVVPQDGWDGDATIHVRVYDKDNKRVTFQADITDRNGHIWVHDRFANSDILELNKYYCPADKDAKCDSKGILAPNWQEKAYDIRFSLTVDRRGVITP